MSDMNLDDIHDVMDDMRDIQDDQAEIMEAFTRNYDVDVEDSELDAGKYDIILELDQLDYEMKVELDAKDLTVPNKRVLTKKENDELELEEMLK